MVKKSKAEQIRNYLSGLSPEERETPTKAKQYVLKRWSCGDPQFYTALKTVRTAKGERLGPLSGKTLKKTKAKKTTAKSNPKSVVNSLFMEFKAVKNLARDFGSLSRVKEVVELLEVAQAE